MPFDRQPWDPPGRERLREAARLVLEVVPGERPLLPEFGCRIHGLAELNSSEQRQIGAALVEEAVGRWIPELRITRAEIAGVADGRITVRLRALGSWHEVEIAHRLDRFRRLAGDGAEPEDTIERGAVDSGAALNGARETT